MVVCLDHWRLSTTLGSKTSNGNFLASSVPKPPVRRSSCQEGTDGSAWDGRVP